MSIDDMSAEEKAGALFALLPPIRRARLWRLYAQESVAGRPRRFLDLWMDGGRSILGAKGRGLGGIVKAAVDQGLSRPLPSRLAERLNKALKALYPDFAAASFFMNEDRALAALGALGARPKLLRPFNEFLHEAGADTAYEIGQADFAVLILPCPRAFAPGVVLIRDAQDRRRLPGEFAPPLALSSALGSLREFGIFARSYNEELWKKSDRRLSTFFTRRGPWLVPRHDESEHENFFRAALEVGLLFSPLYAMPSLLPGDFDDGELARLT